MTTPSSSPPHSSPTTPPSSPPQSSPPSTFAPSQSTLRNTRGITQCTKMAIHSMTGRKHPYDVDPDTGKVVRKHQTVLSSYLGIRARDKISILYPRWKDVPRSVKNQIWKDVLRNFDIKNTKEMRRKVLSSVGTKWRYHKTCLTKKAISEPEGENICARYNIPLEDWEKFKSIRNDPSWATIRKKAQETQKMNTTPHAMSRGGYALLEERIMEEKLKKRQKEAAQSGVESVGDPPSPPSRHLKWKLARIKQTGSMTSEAAKKIVDRIDLLEEQCKEGTFILEGRQDILTAAIGKPEHPGRVRAAGFGVGIRQYFGSLPRGSTTSSYIDPEELQRLTQKITEDVKQQVMKQFGPILQSLNSQSQQPPVVEVDATPITRMSTMGSCAVAAATDHSCEMTPTDASDRCGLYIKGDPIRLVAIGRVHREGSTLHGRPLSDELVRVAVEEVLDADAPVPKPNEEVQLVGQAIGGFIAWPRNLMKAFSAKDTQQSKRGVPVVDTNKSKPVPLVDTSKPIENRIVELFNVLPIIQQNPLKVPWDATVFGIENDMPLYISHINVLEIFTGKMWLSISTIQFWILFCNKLSMDANNDKEYGFFEPQRIQNAENKQEVTKYMLAHLRESKKQIYLAPYYNEQHWQLLVLVPMENVAVWFCSVGKKPENAIKQIVQSFFKGCQMLSSKRRRKSKLINWIEPQCNQQSEDWECGYFVMHWMLTIIQMGIKKNWKQLFCDTAELSKETIEEIRIQWARYFLEIMNGL